MYYALLTLFVIVSVLLIILALLQKGRGDVGAAFGGGGMGQSIFGAGGVDTVLTKATYWLGAIFLALAVLLSIVPKGEEGSLIERELRNESKTTPSESPEAPEKGRGGDTGTPPPGKTSTDKPAPGE